MTAVNLYYDAPNPSRVFDEFLAIHSIAGNVSTISFSDYIQTAGPLLDYKGLRLVIQSPMGQNRVNLARLALSAGMPRLRTTRLPFSMRS